MMPPINTFILFSLRHGSADSLSAYAWERGQLVHLRPWERGQLVRLRHGSADSLSTYAMGARTACPLMPSGRWRSI
ncbi:MAG: hypothetical protein M5U34_08205 [Chloroflexi bacterium]|nr:hypothetical protein [Chloroflexota bacterium]